MAGNDEPKLLTDSEKLDLILARVSDVHSGLRTIHENLFDLNAELVQGGPVMRMAGSIPARIVLKFPVERSERACVDCNGAGERWPGPNLYIEGNGLPICHICAASSEPRLAALVELLERAVKSGNEELQRFAKLVGDEPDAREAIEDCMRCNDYLQPIGAHR